MDRRDFLKLVAAGALGAALPGCSDKLSNLFGPENERLWGLNVHPYTGEYADVQLQALREMGIEKIRITLGLESDLAGHYVSSYPAQYIGLVGDFNLGGVTARRWPQIVRNVLNRSPDVSYLEILNEPYAFMRLSAGEYVMDYLRPAFEIIREKRPGTPVIAAAPRGTSDGSIYFYQMTDAGADNYCDFRGVHLYNNDSESYLFGTDRPFMVTETGTDDPGGHVRWWTDNMPHMSRVLNTDQLYFYVLMDRPATGHNIISPDTGGQPKAVSPLYDYIIANY